MSIPAEDQYASLRQHVHGRLQAGSDANNVSRRDCASPETVNIDLTVSSHSSSRGATSEGNAAATPAVPTDFVSPFSKTARTTAGEDEHGELTASHPATNEHAAAAAVPVMAPPPVAEQAEEGARERAGAPAADALVAPLSHSEGAAEVAQLQTSSEDTVPPRTSSAQPQQQEAEMSSPPASRPKPGGTATPAAQRQPSRSSVSRTLLTSPTPAKQKSKVAVPAAAARVADLLSGICGSPSKSGSPEKAKGSGAPPPLSALDLPLGLLLLYCAAEDTIAAAEGAAPSPTTTTAAYSLLYQLERLSDLRRRDRRRAAREQARATEETKCAELFAAATKRRAVTAAEQAARAQEVAAAELGACTFHPDVSPAAQATAGKGTKEFMAKCLEWREEADRRLRQKYARQAELEAEQAAAAAAQCGITAPGTAMTERSRQLLEEPAVQERMKARPSLWESRKPAVDATTATAATAYVPGVPVGSRMEEEQEAVLRTLRRRGDNGQASTLGHPADVSGASATKGGAVVRQFLTRVEEDARRRETAAAQLASRYHNPEMDRFEAGTGQPLFAPNAMPTVWKDGRRVGYEALSKDEQRDFCEELRKVGLDFVLARHRKDSRGASVGQERSSGGGGGAEESDAAVHPALSAGALTADQQARFLASLKEALTRREQNLARVRAQATAEETFHPHITPHSTKLARHKIGGKPIHERSTAARDAAAVPPHSAHHSAEAGTAPSVYTAHRDRPLPEAAAVFLARNEQWTGARQRRLERLAEREEERRFGDCTFSPNRTFSDPDDAHLQTSESPAMAAERGAVPLAALDASREGSDAARHRAARLRHQEAMATAADVRLMNELELLRSGAAFRNELFVQAVCEQSGVADKRQAMANLSLQSAPRLSGSRAGAASVEPHHHHHHRHSHSRHHTASALHSPSEQLSPIATRSNRPSASPYALPRRLDSYGEAPPGAAYETQRTVPMVRTESGATHTPNRLDSHGREGGASLRSSASRTNARAAAAAAAEQPPVEDPWAALDAQTDAILRRHGY